MPDIVFSSKTCITTASIEKCSSYLRFAFLCICMHYVFLCLDFDLDFLDIISAIVEAIHEATAMILQKIYMHSNGIENSSKHVFRFRNGRQHTMKLRSFAECVCKNVNPICICCP